jgi:hypothetical protein
MEDGDTKDDAGENVSKKAPFTTTSLKLASDVIQKSHLEVGRKVLEPSSNERQYVMLFLSSRSHVD